MSFTITIGGREAIPVRAVPFITGWEMSPDRVAAVLALDDFIFQTIRGEPIALTAYHQVDGNPHPMLPKEWNSVLGTLKSLSSNLVAGAWDIAEKIAKPQPVRDTVPLPVTSLSEWLELSPEERDQRLLATCDDDPIANIRHTAHVLTRDRWQREAVEILPAGVFVWRDDFEQAFHRVYGRLLMIDEKPGDREMNFSPWILEESRRVVMAGFADGSPHPEEQVLLVEDANEAVSAPKQTKISGIDRAAVMRRRRELGAANGNKVNATLATEFCVSEGYVRRIVREEKSKPRSGAADMASQLAQTKVHKIGK